jgi:hypothetical protein
VARLLAGAPELMAPNKLVGGAAVEPKIEGDVAVETGLLLCAPPKLNGLLAGCDVAGGMLKTEPENALDPAPFVAGAAVEEAKGFAPPAEKLKALADGGCGLNAFALSAPKAGNDELEKALFGAGACAGGKLFVAFPPKPPPPGAGCCCEPKPKEFVELSAMGAVAPKLNPDDCA